MIIMLKLPVSIKFTLSLTLLTLLISMLHGSAAAQGIKTDARLISQQGTVVLVNGHINIQQSTHFEGSLLLTGDLIDDFGLEVNEGRVVFSGAGQDQFLSGDALSIFNELEIGLQASLQITAGKRVTVNGELLYNNETAGLRLLSDNTGSASLIHASQAVRAVVQRYFYTASGQVQMLSSPVAYQAIEPDFYSSGDVLYAWYEPFGTYVEYSNNIFHPTFLYVNQGADYFLPATGYYAYYPPGETGEVIKEYSGDLHQGEVSFVLSCAADPEILTNNNLVGNPYPSAIDWNAEEGWSGKEHLAGGKAKRDKPAWVWNEERQNFGVIHPHSKHAMHNKISGIIPAMTVFWVETAPGSHGEMLTMDDRVRVHGILSEEKRQPGGSSGMIRISIGLENQKWRDEVLIEYGHESRLVGASKMFSVNHGAPQLYVVHDEQNYSLLFLDNPAEPHEFMLGHLVPANSRFSLDAYVADDLPVQLFLHDRLNNRQHVLTGREDAVSFRSDSSHHAEDRFVLKIQPVEGQ